MGLWPPDLTVPVELCASDGRGLMLHPGLPHAWGILILGSVALFSAWTMLSPADDGRRQRIINLGRLPMIGPALQRLLASPWILLALKLVTVGFFLLVIYAGLSGTQIPERNIATVLTWNLWWAGLIFSILLVGSAWCAVCPWDALAQWLVKRRLWRRAGPETSLNLKVPRMLNNLWPALLLFVGLTWLELGLGITTSPYLTALVALLMVVLATLSLAIFRKKAFCRHFCPVGRTIGSYSQLAPVELRPIDTAVCARCETLECYHGTNTVDPCPTSLVMGRLRQNAYCTSCGNCVRSCPQHNIAWRLRSPAVEAIEGGRPHWDEAWFMVSLLALTILHGVTMMPFWETAVRRLARLIGDSGQLLWSFSIGMAACLTLIAGLFAAAVGLGRWLSGANIGYRRAFSALAFTTLPLAFAYHLAHNLMHLVRETGDFGALLANPLGVGALPLTMAERHSRQLDMWLAPGTLHALQTGLMIAGFIIAAQTLKTRGMALFDGHRPRLALTPLLLFIIATTLFQAWMLMQPMVMRM